MRRQLALGGIVGPILFLVILLIAGQLTPNYSHVGQMISELGASGTVNPWLINYAGFVASGTLISLFGLSLFTVPRSATALVGAALIVVFGLCMLVAGIYSCDFGCAPVVPSAQQLVHEQVSQVAFTALILATLVWGARYVRDARGRGFGVYSLVTGVVAIVLLTAFIRTIEMEGSSMGLLQRILVAVLYIWLAEFSRRVREEWATTH